MKGRNRELQTRFGFVQREPEERQFERLSVKAPLMDTRVPLMVRRTRLAELEFALLARPYCIDRLTCSLGMFFDTDCRQRLLDLLSPPCARKTLQFGIASTTCGFETFVLCAPLARHVLAAAPFARKS